MHHEQLVEEYLDGRLSRRALIRGLIAGGASIGGAMALAEALPETAAATPLPGLFPELTVGLKGKAAAQIGSRGFFTIKAFFSDDLMYLKIAVFRRGSNGLKLITGYARTSNLTGPQTLFPDVTFGGYTPAAGDRIVLSAEAKDGESHVTYSSANVTLK